MREEISRRACVLDIVARFSASGIVREIFSAISRFQRGKSLIRSCVRIIFRVTCSRYGPDFVYLFIQLERSFYKYSLVIF